MNRQQSTALLMSKALRTAGQNIKKYRTHMLCTFYSCATDYEFPCFVNHIVMIFSSCTRVMFAIHSVTAAYECPANVRHTLCHRSLRMPRQCSPYTLLQQHTNGPSMFAIHSVTAAYEWSVNVRHTLFAGAYHGSCII